MATLSEDPRATYDAFASVYDLFTSNHRHEPWLETIESVARRNGLRGRRLLDLACGTGSSFLPLLERGYAVTGCDVSAEMLRVAARKAPAARLVNADVRQLPPLGDFDLITCLDDSLNYLAGVDELESAFRGVAANLAPTGLFVFDVNTLAAYRSTFASDHCLDAGGRFFAWRGQESESFTPGSSAVALIEIFSPRATYWDRAISVHRQRHFTPDEVRAALVAGRLELVAAYGHRSDGRLFDVPDETADDKRIYVARRPQ
ncbi:MAG: class I SAM-dependent DNA methyltransferase [Thermoleophilaceae bacterium]